MDEITCYVFDMNYAFQNIFLKDLFDNDVTLRKPLDPKFKVLSTDPEEIKQLMHYFKNDTAFGKGWKRADQDVIKAMEPLAGS